jgi:hypothetical protein
MAGAFSMMPLCTTATSHFSSVCGWALRSVGGPCVAQRVWAMPNVPSTGRSPMAASSRAILPAALRVSTPWPFCTATPAES